MTFQVYLNNSRGVWDVQVLLQHKQMFPGVQIQVSFIWELRWMPASLTGRWSRLPSNSTKFMGARVPCEFRMP